MTLSDRLYFELYSLVLLYVGDDFEQVAGLPTLAAYGNTIVQGTSDQVPSRLPEMLCMTAGIRPSDVALLSHPWYSGANCFAFPVTFNAISVVYQYQSSCILLRRNLWRRSYDSALLQPRHPRTNFIVLCFRI